MPRISMPWLPAALIALVLAFLVLVSGLRGQTPAGAAAVSTVSPTSTAAGVAVGHAYPIAQHRSVIDEMGAQTDYVRFCVGASLEPFAGVLDELRTQGSREALLRFQDCLAETIFYHDDNQTLAQMREHVTYLGTCYREIVDMPATTKNAVVDATTQCILDITATR